ncbi:hypothetical protein T11_17092 [Trichinella zimbabwensis]|uniref:Uncharacterized protein n=1 Tax=Trichinella zimbabwensis TaxID=268475 RepID=A0A0V1HPI2_9BILA|nr:hypothetical protein T11_17092 [Trichinella zimbabwensis]
MSRLTAISRVEFTFFSAICQSPAPCAAINLCLHWRFDAALPAPCPAKLLSLTPTSVGHRLSGRRPFHRRKDKQRHFDQSASPISSRRNKSAFVPSSFTSS